MSWNSLGDVRELEKIAAALERDKKAAELGRLTLQLVANVRYVNGCVARGRGTDLDANHPMNNIFEYIKELEDRLKAAEEQLDEALEETVKVQSKLDAEIIRCSVAEYKLSRYEEVAKQARKVEKWFGEFPPTGKQWSTGEEMSYGAAYGSNGERDYMRSILRAALNSLDKEE